MLVHVPRVLDADQVARCRAVLERAAWADGRAVAGFQPVPVKDNLQLPEGAPEARDLGDMVMLALKQSPLFLSAALPHTVFPPLFNRYEAGMAFGPHVDNAIRQSAGGLRIRTDIAATLFLSAPEDHDGGELVIEDTDGSHAVKHPAGDLVIYPADSLHAVTPVTRGSRLACILWIQSLVRDRTRRALLFDLDASIRHLARDVPGHAALAGLTGTYHNLLRQWSDL